MNLSRSKYIALALAALLIMAFLYIKTQAVDLDKHNQLLEHINKFKQVDAVLNQHILQTHQGLLPFYDPTVGEITKLIQLQITITQILDQLDSEKNTNITQRLKEVKQVLLQKETELEDFKSRNAILHNSLRYLPSAISHVSTQLPYDKEGNRLRQTLNNLLRNLLIYNMNNEMEFGLEIEASTKILKQSIVQNSFGVRDDLSILLSHVDIVLKNKNKTDQLIQNLMSMPIVSSLDKLIQTYSTIHDQKIQSVNIYRQILYVFSILLLACIAYILFRLNQSTAILQRTVTELNYQKFAMDEHAIISISDKDGMITYANQKFCDINQRTAEELIGQNHRISKSSYHTESFYKDIWDTVTKGEVWHGQIQNSAKDGRNYWVETTIVPFVDDSGVPYQYVAIRTDITGIKQAEEQLHLQSEALRVAANSIVITDNKGNIQWVNDAFSLLTGYSKNEAIGQKISLLKSNKQDPEFYRNMWQTILEGGVWHGEIINQRKDGNFYTEEQTISPVIDEHGETTHFIAIKQDITERLQTEETLRRSQKMEAIGQLSGGIAHDFNNQLGIVLGYLDFLDNYFTQTAPEAEKAHKWVNTANKASLRCVDLTRQLLSFSRRQVTDKVALDINKIFTDLETMISRSVTPEIEVQYYLSENLWLTEINSGEFQDVIINLVINARDAMPNGGKISIETTNIHIDKNNMFPDFEIKGGEYVELVISDTGEGMSKETQEHIFEPFFTTKPDGKGTGLGMAMVYGFIKRYDGNIKIYSELGVGTTFRIFLPRSSSSQPININKNKKTLLPTGSESVLIVDDEVDLLELAEHFFSELGYHTQIAENGIQALEILKSSNKIDLLFSDIIMPGGINGYELAQQASQLQPELKILMTSGYTSKSIVQDGQEKFSTNLLSKPYRKADLAKKVRLILDGETETQT